MTATDLDLDALLDALAARALERARPAPLVNAAGEEVTPYASTGRLTVNPGDTIASVWGNTTFDQTVQAYDNTAGRDSQWPAPKDGAVAYTADTGTVWLRRAGAWVTLAGPPPPVTSGSGIQSAADANGDIWVAKVGVNGGAWRKAANVLHARWYRAAAWSTAAGAGVPIVFDTVDFDAYGLWVSGSSGFVAPVAGVYRAGGAFTAPFAATGQYVQLTLVQGAAQIAQNTLYGAGVVNGSAAVTDIVRAAAGDVLSVQARTTAVQSGLTGRGLTYFNVDYVGTG